MATLTVQNTLLTGLTPSYSAVASSDVFPNDGRTIRDTSQRWRSPGAAS